MGISGYAANTHLAKITQYAQEGVSLGLSQRDRDTWTRQRPTRQTVNQGIEIGVFKTIRRSMRTTIANSYHYDGSLLHTVK